MRLGDIGSLTRVVLHWALDGEIIATADLDDSAADGFYCMEMGLACLSLERSEGAATTA